MFYLVLSLCLLNLSSFCVAQNPPDWQPSYYIQNARVGLKCQGDFPAMLQPLLSPLVDPFYESFQHGTTYSNLLDLCARSDWAGRPINAGGRCSGLTHHPQEILFDPMPPINMLTLDWLKLYCITKCYCMDGTRQTLSQLPRFTSAMPSSTIYGVFDDETFRVNPLAGADTHQRPLRMFMEFTTIQRFVGFQTYSMTTRLTGLLARAITCDGDNAPFLFPPGGTTWYPDLLAVCAASIYGGDNRGNMGASCAVTPNGEPAIKFSAFFRHPDAHGDYADMLEMYCALKCKCASVVRMDPKYAIRPSGEVVQVIDLGQGTILTRDSYGIERLMSYFPAELGRVRLRDLQQPESSQPTVTCSGHSSSESVFGNEVCSPANGPGIITTMMLLDPIQPRPALYGRPDHKCPINKECSSQRDCDGCRCHAVGDVRSVNGGSAKLFAKGICQGAIGLAALSVERQIRSSKRPGNRRRGLGFGI